ncbi:protein translocase subunit SecF [Cellulomonas composti]|uniref:Protein-export membrane protein SecF n=1 Tax=Cellulomonas composti TaxID=266130 RepID=A0A511J6P0_9CELL|nr:protein translocase subunit SecF [Cellulomonas composti]GEL93661.1 protein-export membrane protein SecF [Cellulomonas composti]
MAAGFAQWGNDLYTGRRSYDIVGRRRVWYLISAVLLVASAFLLVKPGLNPGIEFRGGTEFVIAGVEGERDQQKAIDTVQSVAPGESPEVTNLGDDSMRVQTAELTDEEGKEVADALEAAFPGSEVSRQFVGPTWGADVSRKAITGIGVFLVFVSLVMTLYFRNWRMAVAALVALAHDLVITVGVYAGIGWEVTPATVIGFLTILGYSIYDTVVVFDKVRENTADALDQTRFTYAEKANLAVNQTLVRSINTSVVALLPVGAILFVGAVVLGAGTLRDIALALFVGMLIGTFSSVFIATPIEVTLREREPKIKAHTQKVLAARAAGLVDAPDSEAIAAGSGVRPAGQLRPGSHQGQAAQPKRNKPR